MLGEFCSNPCKYSPVLTSSEKSMSIAEQASSIFSVPNRRECTNFGLLPVLSTGNAITA